MVILTLTTSTFAVTLLASASLAKNSDVQFVAGPDYLCGVDARVPSETQNTKVSINLFPSANKSPQPSTYYTDLIHIKNFGKTSCKINSITVSNIEGTSNLGCLSIFLFANQTDKPLTSTPLGCVLLTNASAGTKILCGNYTLEASQTGYIEVVGYAAPNATADSTASFTLTIQC